MPDFGFPAQPRSASMRSLIAQLRERADDSRVAAVTGRYADVTRELDGRVSELMEIEKSINDLQQYAEAIAIAEARATVTQESLERIRTGAQELADVVTVLNTNGTDSDFEVVSAQAFGEFEGAVAVLNRSLGGRALFAGDSADIPAVADAATIMTGALPFLEGQGSAAAAYAALETQMTGAGGLFDTTVYLGGAGTAPETEIAAGERVDHSVKADDPALRRVLFNTVVLAAAYDLTNAIPAGQRRELALTAGAALREDIGQIAQVEGQLGVVEARIANIKARNIASDASLGLSFNELAGADTYEAALTLTDLDTQLETAFATTARLANLTLANFR